MDVDKAIGEHYGRPGLEESILAALAAAGRDPERIRPEDIADIDELHVGGATTVRQLAHDVGLTSHARILDIGSGLGGPARQYAREFGAIVDGIDVTPRFVTTAASLTRRSGITAGVTFTLGSALDLPYEDAVFDAATMIHVGMNIEDKSTLFRSVARVLKPGARFAIFDFMVVGDGKVEYPLPWADTVDTSFLATPDDYLSLLGDAGFAIDKQESRQQAASEGPVSRASSGNEGPPPVLGLQLVLGENVATRMANISAARARGVLAPIEIVSHIERPA
ncbi:SAM-dependent methyltransferase [Cryobacterium mesophilum]|uniref:class I SAM-dependent methyltransferase n=1 Tax=Terrimesophilobacter mesophilus TaxID=433647 RepID=UPI001425631E|nr:class I SAM-dependent methyltransferase [Terrimesophilobacter mesophilus]MBB5634110.1 SAM-dependent methyltransferase [Terrimesophilobacter mesophilus]